jgi:hypothetical protein
MPASMLRRLLAAVSAPLVPSANNRARERQRHPVEEEDAHADAQVKKGTFSH